MAGRPTARATAEHRRRVELLALVGLASHEGEWHGAVAVGEVLHEPWRPLAFALRRLAERGVVIERIEEVRGTARATEQTRRYRFGEGVRNPFVPPVVPPRPGVARRVYGRAWRDDDGERDLWKDR